MPHQFDANDITLERVLSVSELCSLLQFLERKSGPFPAQYSYRGQSRTWGKLEPALNRRLRGLDVSTAAAIEKDLMQSFRSGYRSLYAADSSMPHPDDLGPGRNYTCLSVMQHYGVPTRLLDWTSNAWTALFFACSASPSHDAELWIYDGHIFHPRSSPFTKSLPRDSQPQCNEPELHDPDFEESEVAQLFPRYGPRLRKQSGHHTCAYSIALTDHAPPLFYWSEGSITRTAIGRTFFRIELSASMKPELLYFLSKKHHVSYLSLFPDFDGLARQLDFQIANAIEPK